MSKIRNAQEGTWQWYLEGQGTGLEENRYYWLHEKNGVLFAMIRVWETRESCSYKEIKTINGTFSKSEIVSKIELKFDQALLFYFLVSELQEEGINAINLPLSPIPFELDPEDTMLEENEVRTMVDPNSRNDPKLQELMKVLIDWINDVLVGERIIVKDLAEDLYDGQVLQKLFEKLESEKLNVAEVTQSEIAQKQKLQTVLEKINETLKLPPRSIKWNVDSVHAKSLVAILHLLVALSQYFRAPIRLPDHVSIQVVVVQKREGILQSRQIQEEITGNTEALSGRHERDAFDTLFDHAPDKLNVVKKTLITFVNKHLNKLNLEVTELETQFADGVYLVLLMGLLEGYFVPLHSFFLTPDSFEQKVLNVSFAFELMQDGGLEKPKPRPEDIVNCDLKSTLRVLYNLFTKYRNVE
ncbi:hypothetical protein QYF61_027201 [Mycteria americana]|uniref:Calponin-homology (CH) domain-containing protein n=1 Tax=Mycteria americana TaxID=33587 RepID=A0AAN7NVL6_MYCAM|nr:hypothetical protein QYF61_027201 [Mycteria americana]